MLYSWQGWASGVGAILLQVDGASLVHSSHSLKVYAIHGLTCSMNWCMIMNEGDTMKNNSIKKGEKMSFAVSINSSGQATIPKAVREYLGVVPGENRIIFDFVNGKVVLGREPSRKEMLEASLQRIWAINEEEERKNPEVKRLKKKYAGMTFNEVRDAYDATPEGREEFKEKYGFYPVA